jgi:type VI secretion system protein ImpG
VPLKIDAQFPAFTQHLLQTVYPHYLAPTPSMGVVQFQPDLKEAGLAQGYTIARDTVLRSVIGHDDRTPCEYRTAHDCVLYPLELAEAKYYASAAALASIGVQASAQARAGIRLTLRSTAGVPLSALQLDRLPVYLSGADELPSVVYENVFAASTGFLIRARGGEQGAAAVVAHRDGSCIQRCGFDESEALIPYSRRSFQGYRLLHEYFAFPERFLFFTLADLRSALADLPGQEFDVIILLNRSLPWLESSLSTQHFRLFCTPVVNLVSRRADRIHLDHSRAEYHVVADRTRPQDFEIFAVERAEGFGTSTEPDLRFEPFYASTESTWHGRNKAFFTIRREPRMLSSKERAQGPRTSYIGSEVFVSLVDADHAPYSHDLRQLGLRVLCTNRDLPLTMPIGKGSTDFTTDIGAPLQAIRCIAGPSKPRASVVHGEYAWRLLSHLSLNYLSLIESSAEEGASALRELLQLYCDPNDAATQRQIDGVRHIATRPASGRLPDATQVSYVRGLEIALTCEDEAFQGRGAFVLASVLEEFFSRYVSLNSFTRTVLRTPDRGEVMRWPARLGRRTVL